MIVVGLLLLLALVGMFVGGLWYEIRLRDKTREVAMNAAAWILLALVVLLGFFLMATIRHGLALVVKHGEQEKHIRILTELAETQHQVIGRLLGGDPAELDTNNDEEEMTQ